MGGLLLDALLFPIGTFFRIGTVWRLLEGLSFLTFTKMALAKCSGAVSKVVKDRHWRKKGVLKPS